MLVTRHSQVFVALDFVNSTHLYYVSYISQFKVIPFSFSYFSLYFRIFLTPILETPLETFASGINFLFNKIWICSANNTSPRNAAGFEIIDIPPVFSHLSRVQRPIQNDGKSVAL